MCKIEVNGLHEKVDRAAMERIHRHLDVAVPGDEDERQNDAALGHGVLKGSSKNSKKGELAVMTTPLCV